MLKVENFYWDEGAFRPSPEHTIAERPSAMWRLRGQFALALDNGNGGMTLVRDRLGINKLFFAIHESGRVLAANYLADLLEHGVPAEAIYSVPAGHMVDIDAKRESLGLTRYFHLRDRADGTPSLAEVVKAVRSRLEAWFARMADQFGDRRVCLCLSGGLDSGIIAAFARRHFDDLTAYTYTYAESGVPPSEDAYFARRLADFLGIPLRVVPATKEDILASVEPALRYGQDWRDFNVHCAIVNDILGSAIAADAREDGASQRPLVLTGDLMNEILADYAPVSFDGHQYYPLPNIKAERLRLVLIRGLDAGDREVGVFNRHGLDVLQPYGLLIDEYLQLPEQSLSKGKFKQELARLVAGDLLPSFIFNRAKVRAQIGNSNQPTGILPLMVRSGYDSTRLKEEFCRLLGVSNAFLDSFIRAGIYRCLVQFPRSGVGVNGYIYA